jgi:TP901 family phage tail tape measure protein
MALSGLGLGVEFWAKDRASPVMQKVRKEMGKTSDQAKELELRQKKAAAGIKRGTAMMAAGVGALAVVNKATKAFGEFEFVLASAAGKMVDGAENLKALEKAALRAGKLTQFSPLEAAQGLAELGAQGLAARESMAALMPTLNLAAASMGQLGVAEAAGVGMAALNAFGRTVEDLPKVVDQLTVVSDSSAFQMRDFQVAISQAAAQAKASDQSFESMLSMLGLLRDSGLEASSAATAYREAMRRVAGDKLAIKAMKKLKVSSVDAKGQMKDFSQIVAELYPRLQKMGVQERNLALQRIFGVRGMKAYSAVISSYEKNLKKGVATAGEYTKGHDILMDRLGKAHGATAAKVKKALDTTGGQYKLLAGSWQTTVIQFGKVFAKAMLPVLKKFTAGLNWVIDALDEMSPATKKIAGYTVVYGAVLLTLIGAYKVLKGFMMMMTLGRLAGRYIAGQAAMATSTTATTGAVVAQNTALAVSTTRVGRFRAAIGGAARGVAAWAGTVTMVGAAAVATGHFLGKWMIDRLTKTSEKAQDAQQKVTNFRLAWRRFNRTIKRSSEYMNSFNQRLRDQTKILIKTASVSSRAAEKVLSKVTATVGKLSIARQKALVGMYKAIRKKDIKAATTYRKEAFEIERKMAALAEARVHIRARQYQREIGMVKNKSKREHMAQSILLSGVIKQQQMQMTFAKKREEMAAGIRAIDDPIERKKAIEKATALWAKQQSKVESGQMRIAKQAQKFGLLPKGFVSTADYDKIFARMKPLMHSTGVMGAQLQLTLKQLTIANKGAAIGRLTPARIKAMGELREAAALAAGRAPKVAAGERGRYEEALKRGTAPAAERRPAEAIRGGYQDIQEFASFWSAGIIGAEKEELAGAIRDAYRDAKVELLVEIKGGDEAADARVKARGGHRFKPTARVRHR